MYMRTYSIWTYTLIQYLLLKYIKNNTVCATMQHIIIICFDILENIFMQANVFNYVVIYAYTT